MLFTEFVSEPSGLPECDGYPWGRGYAVVDTACRQGAFLE